MNNKKDFIKLKPLVIGESAIYRTILGLSPLGRKNQHSRHLFEVYPQDRTSFIVGLITI